MGIEGLIQMYRHLLEQLSAIETLSINRSEPQLNSRGEKILRWLRRRYYNV